MGIKPNRRAERALEVFQGMDIVHYHDLPDWVGFKTMEGLVRQGLIEVADKSVSIQSKHYGWRLVK